MIRFEPQLHFAHVRIITGRLPIRAESKPVSAAMWFAPAAEMRTFQKRTTSKNLKGRRSGADDTAGSFCSDSGGAFDRRLE
jgi:hypothetical protein